MGGGLRSYGDASGPLLDGYEEAEVCSGGRGQPLIPWPNRVRDGRYEFAGADQQLALTEPDHHNAIHGLVRWANWDLAHRDADRVTMATRCTRSRDGRACSSSRSPTRWTATG